MEFREKIIEILINAGTEGVKQSQITYTLSPDHAADEVLEELELLAIQHKVQKFVVGGRGRPKTIWRATTEILK